MCLLYQHNSLRSPIRTKICITSSPEVKHTYRAAPLLERAVALQPELLEAHYQLSGVLVILKRTDEANRELGIFKELSEKQKARNESRRDRPPSRECKVLVK